MKLATLCYLRRNGRTLMLHRIKKQDDIHEGKWRSCESAPAVKTEAGLVVNVSPDQALSLLLVTESGGATKWCKAIERAMNDPASLP